MSRSYKHVPCAHFVRRHGGMKRLFNKRERRLGIDAVGSHGAYRKANETWDDDDWRVVHHALRPLPRPRRRGGAPLPTRLPREVRG